MGETQGQLQRGEAKVKERYSNGCLPGNSRTLVNSALVSAESDKPNPWEGQLVVVSNHGIWKSRVKKGERPMKIDEADR